jgi:hypothetical protein
MAWSAEQVASLQAMGLTPYVRPGAVPIAQSAGIITTDRLSSAVRRAARGRDVDALLADLEGLRRDPQRKRQLWPQLRTLRRAG